MKILGQCKQKFCRMLGEDDFSLLRFELEFHFELPKSLMDFCDLWDGLVRIRFK
jgi:hypothetical protein